MYHVSGMIDPGFSVDMVLMPRSATGTASVHGVSWRVVVVGDDIWLSGSALWKATLPAARAAQLGDGWVHVTDGGAAFGHAQILSKLFRGIATVIFGPHSGLKVTGRTTVGGRPAVELRNATDVYDVAGSGTPYPLRWLDTDTPGPNGQPCGITLDGFDAAAVAVTPPPDVVGTVVPSPHS